MVNTLYGRTRTVQYRRKRTGRTDYKRRLALLKSEQPRLVVRKSLKHITAQLVEYHPDGDRIVASANSHDLEKMGWKGYTANTSAAYLVGLLIGKRAVQKKIKNAVLDIGLAAKGSKIFAAAKGAVDGGLDIPLDPVILPKDERIHGGHIVNYAAALKKDAAAYQRRFSHYSTAKLNPEDLTMHVEQLKKKIIAEYNN
ncbi:50S ribosomal protein L18 [Candidatus Woesearchaeota archaeon]|nr:50S ribosomal protein L18 [Candidatus Woesearchaeota archaeon]